MGGQKGITHQPPQSNSARDGFLYSAAPALASGAIQAVLFNPFDRALYVRVRYRRERFLDRRNFELPFQGFMNAAVYRTLVGASYMFWQDSARIFINTNLPHRCHEDVSPRINSFLIGLFAGSLNGLALNNLQAVKFNMWNSDAKSTTFVQTTLKMYSDGGVRVFFRGCSITVFRDVIFGVVYESVRRAVGFKVAMDTWVLWWERQALKVGFDFSSFSACIVTPSKPQHDPTATSASNSIVPVHVNNPKCGTCAFISNLVAAILASIASSPVNYLRSMAYATPPGSQHLGYLTLLRSMIIQTKYIYYNGESFMAHREAPPNPSVRVENQTATASNASERHAKVVDSQHVSNGTNNSSSNSKHDNTTHTTSSSEAGKKGSSHSSTSTSSKWFHRQHHYSDVDPKRPRRHPVRAWRWLNSRLNIGWGSLRVGLGMAVGQSLFHLVQDYVRSMQQAKIAASGWKDE